jgi:hypothetical protein
MEQCDRNPGQREYDDDLCQPRLQEGMLLGGRPFPAAGGAILVRLDIVLGSRHDYPLLE